MVLLQLIGETIALLVASLVGAAILCLVVWNAFKIVRHPELGVPLAAIALILAFHSAFNRSELFRLTLIFAIMAAPLFWIIGRDWCSEHRRRATNGRS